jgi:hypothetical protein
LSRRSDILSLHSRNFLYTLFVKSSSRQYYISSHSSAADTTMAMANRDGQEGGFLR